MKSSLWILNSALAILLLGTLIFIIFSIKDLIKLPSIASIKPLAGLEVTTKESQKPKDIKTIYEDNDLFGTYSPITLEKIPETIPELPQPPSPKPIISQPAPTIQFLEPLPIKISGIISHSVEAKSQVTLVNTNTKQSQSFKVGNKVFDAHIIRIFPKKIILLRSNGQQETLYMYPEDAQVDIKNLKGASWNDVVLKQSESSYLINAVNFVNRVNLAKLIDMLDAKTAFSKGQSVGCWIGKMDENSIGYALGLLPEDVIININNIPPTTTANRIKIYDSIQNLKSDSKVKVEILRNNKYFALEYIINDNLQAEPPKKEIIAQQQFETKKNADIEITKSNISIKDEKNKLNNPVQKLKKNDRQSMLEYGSKKSVLANAFN